MAPFDNCWKRIERAETHREAFSKAWDRAIESKDPYRPIVGVDDKGTWRIWIEQPLHLSAFLPIVALELGEMLYQLRAALDASVYECAILETKKNPPPNENALEFPICRTQADFNKAAWKIRPLAQKQRDIIESVQPYNIDKLPSQTAVHDHSRNLWLIYDWSRIDRHRRLHSVGSWATISQPTFVLPEGVSVSSLVVNDSGFLEHESEIARFRLDGWFEGMTVEANFNPGISIDVAIDEIPPKCAPNDTTWNRLHHMAITTRVVVQWLQDSFC